MLRQFNAVMIIDELADYFMISKSTPYHLVRRGEALFALADTIEQRVTEGMKRAEALTQSILAFRGELVPTESDLAAAECRDHETAEQLLTRIRGGAANTTALRRHQRRREVTA